MTRIRTFSLVRDEDATGVSGTGLVAQGAEFDDGFVVMRWLTETRSTGHYDSIDDLIHIHGHEGRTRVEWHDVDVPTRYVVKNGLGDFVQYLDPADTPIAYETVKSMTPYPPHVLIEDLTRKVAELEEDRDRWKDDYESACEHFWLTYAAAMDIDINTFDGVPTGTPWQAVADRVASMKNNLFFYEIQFARLRSIVSERPTGASE